MPESDRSDAVENRQLTNDRQDVEGRADRIVTVQRGSHILNPVVRKVDRFHGDGPEMGAALLGQSHGRSAADGEHAGQDHQEDNKDCFIDHRQIILRNSGRHQTVASIGNLPGGLKDLEGSEPGRFVKVPKNRETLPARGLSTHALGAYSVRNTSTSRSGLTLSMSTLT